MNIQKESRTFCYAAFSLKLVITFICAILIFSSTAAALDIGAPVPDFKLKSYSGKEVSLSDFKGKIVVIEWFNKGCPFVKKHYQNGHMPALQTKYAAQNVAWLIINSTNTSHSDYLTPEQTSELVKEWKITATDVLLDTDGAVGKIFDAKVTPHMYVINSDGNLAYQGAIDDDPSAFGDPKESSNFVVTALDSLLSNKAVAKTETSPYGCSVKYAE